MAEEFKPQYNFTDGRLNELKQLFPEAWEDGVFNVDTLRLLIGDYSTDNSVNEHFGLNWVGKQDARKIASKPPTGTLKPAPGEGVNEENTENLFIEGDNLEVLKILRKSYIDKIKMIYIDPPYNTGNDFIYNDSFGDSTEDYLRKSGDKSEEGLLVSNPRTSGKYHANWLTFMYPRLRLAKDLLKDDGVIFMSIDDNEVDNLKKLSDEILGEENFLAVLPWKKKQGGGNDSTYFVIEHEYVLVYAKRKSSFKINLDKHHKLSDNLYPYEDEIGVYGLVTLDKSSIRFSESLVYEITDPDGKKYLPRIVKGKQSCWRWGKEKVQREYDSLVFKNNKVYTKYRKPEGVNPRSLLTDTRFGRTEVGKEEVKSLLGNIEFSYPKPTGLIKHFIHVSASENDIILDFFAGSGTTAHSVFQSNLDENLNLKFILVQLPEKLPEKSNAYKEGLNNLSEISLKRIKRAIEENVYKEGFRVYKQVPSSIYEWESFNPQKDGLLPDLFTKLEAAFKNPLVEGTTPEKFITEVMLQEGFPLTAKQTEVQDGIFKISHDWVPYTLYVSMLQSFKNIDLEALGLSETDHFVCLDMAFENNDALKQTVDNQCKLFTI